MKNIGIILASGTGERSGLDIPKQFVRIAGKPVVEYTIEIFDNHPDINEIILVTNEQFIPDMEKIIHKKFNTPIKIIKGGVTRRESSYNALNSIEDDEANVFIHDAVRPFLNKKIIDDCIKALETYDAVDVAINSADTIIQINDEKIIENIPQRKYYMRGQTPQAFKLSVIKKAHELANNDNNVKVTDDCGLILKYDLGKIFVVDGDDYNIKITYPIDIAIADKLFQLKTAEINYSDLKKLKDKVVIVFGGSRGIGAAVSDLAKKYTSKVYTTSRRLGVDITDYSAVDNYLKEVFEKEGKIDYIINTAGVLKREKFNNRTIEDIQNEIQINYIGCINIAKAGFEYIKHTKGGMLFFTSSSYTRGRAEYAIYSSAKAAIVNLIQGLAEEWNDFEIRINAINPQRTATPMRYENFGEEPEDTLLSPDAVAEKTLSVLLSDLNGQIINVRKDNIK